MEILRVPPYDSDIVLTVSHPLTEYEVRIEDMADHSVSKIDITSTAASKITITLPTKYDTQFLINVDNQELFVDMVRPYVDATTKFTNIDEIQSYQKNEQLARAIIDSIVIEGFYFKKELIQTTGLGSDYLPLWTRAQKLLKLYENNVLIFNSENPPTTEISYGLSEDRTAVTVITDKETNKDEGAPLIIPSGQSDMVDLIFGYRGFPKTFDYTIIVESGYYNVPSDIVYATELLIDDISCGRLDYYKRYIADYNTDQFKIKFDTAIFEGTGNILVDKILSKYVKSIRKLGVL
jgi:hypothetical protein